LQASHEVSFSKAVVSSFADLTKADLTILACPTYDHGLLHTPFDVFLQSAREAKVDLKDQQFVLIGLGDPKYDKDYLVESVRLMQEFVTEHG
jgi:flavodoxin